MTPAMKAAISAFLMLLLITLFPLRVYQAGRSGGTAVCRPASRTRRYLCTEPRYRQRQRFPPDTDERPRAWSREGCQKCPDQRSEERRAGKERVQTVNYRGRTEHEKKKK